MVTGAFCNKTALISSSVTGPADDVDPVFTDDDGVPFAVAVTLEGDGPSSFAEDFDSWFPIPKKD